jgi:hypothetical protein
MCFPNVMRYGIPAPEIDELASRSGVELCDGVALCADGFTDDLECDGGGVARTFASRVRSACRGIATGTCWDEGGS